MVHARVFKRWRQSIAPNYIKRSRSNDSGTEKPTKSHWGSTERISSTLSWTCFYIKHALALRQVSAISSTDAFLAFFFLSGSVLSVLSASCYFWQMFVWNMQMCWERISDLDWTIACVYNKCARCVLLHTLLCARTAYICMFFLMRIYAITYMKSYVRVVKSFETLYFDWEGLFFFLFNKNNYIFYH